MRHSKQTIHLMMLMMGILLMIPRVAFASENPTFVIHSNSNQAAVGSKVQVSVTGKNLKDLVGFEMNIDYDNALLQVEGIQSGMTGYSATIPQSDGHHLQFVFSKVGDVPSDSGTINLATATFKTLATGTALIKLKEIILVDSKTNYIDINGNSQASVVISLNGSTGNNTEGSGGLGGSNGSSSVSLDKGILSLQPSDGNLNMATKVATFTLSGEVLDKVIKQSSLNEQGVKAIEIEVSEVAGAEAYRIEVPSSLFKVNGDSLQIKIVTPLASIFVPSNMFKDTELNKDKISLQIGKVDSNKLDQSIREVIGYHPVIDLMILDGEKIIHWNNPNAPVKVYIPYSPTSDELSNSEQIVVMYLNEHSQLETIPNGRYDSKTGNVVFKTTHFSNYAVSYVKRTFDDIVSIDWAKNQIEALASKGIINGVSDQQFAPEQKVKRSDFLMLLMRTLELDKRTELGPKFDDVKEGEYYERTLRIARAVGIAEGTDNNLFLPNDSITREDMMVLTERAMKLAKLLNHQAESSTHQLSKFEDFSQISSYATSSVAALVRLGLVNGYDNAIHPSETTTRAQAAVLMYNIYSINK